MWNKLLIGLCLAALSAPFAAGAPPEGAPAAKSGYTFFRPTPPELRRQLSADRPDQTESPHTVDAGHWQIELDVVKFTLDRNHADGGEVQTRAVAVAPFNLKVGLLNQVDLQFLLAPYGRVKVEDRVAGTTDQASGFGDLATRLKINLWGNDGGPSVFALMPYVKWPLAASDLRNGQTEGGVIAIWGYGLPGGWSSAVMTEVDFVSDGAGGYHSEWVNSITFAHDLTARLGGYVEFYAVVGDAPGFQWQGQLDVGLTYAVSDYMQLDLGCNFGVTRAAPDYQPFVGLSRCF